MIWEDEEAPAPKRAAALLDAVGGRKELKRLAAWLDARPDRALHAAVLGVARDRGVALPDEAVDWPAKKLLRRGQGRDGVSQVRKNPIARDEDFTCTRCGAAVPAHGRTARDHCPHCLTSVHVDVVPGDRAETCGGRMDAIDLSVDADGIRIHYRCTRCRAERRVRAVLDGDVPDDWSKLVALSSGQLG